jgi:hypothetical protein
LLITLRGEFMRIFRETVRDLTSLEEKPATLLLNDIFGCFQSCLIKTRLSDVALVSQRYDLNLRSPVAAAAGAR